MRPLRKSRETRTRHSHFTSARGSTTTPAATHFARVRGSKPLQKDGCTLSALESAATQWFADCEVRGHSPKTLRARRDAIGKLFWFLNDHGHEHCGSDEVRGFLTYLRTSHTTPQGRWGHAVREGIGAGERARAKQPVKDATVLRYYAEFRALFGWMERRKMLSRSPTRDIDPPNNRQHQVRPFTKEQVQKLYQVAGRGIAPERDQVILMILLGTGIRANELCGLDYENVNMEARTLWVHGKGGTDREVRFGASTARALWKYLRLRETPADETALSTGKALRLEPTAPVFVAVGGPSTGMRLTPNGLLQLFYRWADDSEITGVRISPHTCRHTFAVEFLRDGGDTFTLQQMLGHGSLHMTRRYVALSQADMAAQHRAHDPVARLGLGESGRKYER